MSWTDGKGFWPRLFLLANRLGFRPAGRYLLRRIADEREEALISELLSTCVRTGRSVHAEVDEDGRLRVQLGKGPDDDAV
jgi:hypothetical protein